MNDPLRLAVIGCAGYSRAQIGRIWETPACATVAAVSAVDSNSEGARECREKGIPVFPDIGEMLTYGRFDAVVNPAPIHLHASISLQCLKAGFSVLLEKPPAAVIQDLELLRTEAGRAGLRVAVCFNRLYEEAVQQLKKELTAGRYGKVLRVKGIGAWIRTNDYYARNDWAGKIRLNGDWVLDGTINNPFAHVLCNNLYFAAEDHHALAKPVEVTAELYRCNDIEGEDTSCLRILTREGVEVMTWFTLASATELPPTTVIETEKAVITYEDFRTLVIQFRDGREGRRDFGPTDRGVMIRQICGAFRSGGPFCCDLDMSRAFTKTVNAAFDSSGRIHPIPEAERVAVDTGEAVQITVPGILDIMKKAFKQNALFSEMQIPWARKGELVLAEAYDFFPMRFRENGGKRRIEI